MTRAALYTRVSTQKRADEGYSLDAQERRRREHIEREGWKLVHSPFEEAGTSDKLRSRPELDRLLASLDDLDAVVIYSLDRFGRSTKNLLELTASAPKVRAASSKNPASPAAGSNTVPCRASASSTMSRDTQPAVRVSGVL